MFADGTLVFCQTSVDHMAYLWWLIMWFETILGLKMNLEKSELTPIGRMVNAWELAFHLGGIVRRLPSTYLAFFWALHLNH